MTGCFHFWCVDIKYTLVVCFKFVVMENVFDLVAYFVSVSLTCLLCHFDTTVWHECTFQRFVCLQTNNFFKIFEVFIDVSRAICCQRCNNLCLHIQNAAFCTLFFLEFLQFAPQTVCSLCWSLQEFLISVIWSIVVLNKVTYVDAFFPESSGKAIPLFKFSHLLCSFLVLFCFVTLRHLLCTGHEHLRMHNITNLCFPRKICT